MSVDREADFLRCLRSPTNGLPLRRVGDHILTDGVEDWPYVAGIPYLRTDRGRLREQALQFLKQGDEAGALAVLLIERPDDSPVPPDHAAIARRAVTAAKSIGEAMEHLHYGTMAPYILQRWCLPTYLSGLALLERHAPHGSTMFEAGCGVGHFLRRWMDRSGPAIGADLIFSNLWLARRFTAPASNLICCNLNDGIPLKSHCADFSFAQDAFHYIDAKAKVFSEMRRVARSGMVLLGHAHNATRENFSPGSPLTLEAYQACLDPDLIYDDAQLAKSLLAATPLCSLTAASATAQAFAFVCGKAAVETRPGLFMPKPDTPLRLNPLIRRRGPRWPSAEFQREYVDDWRYLQRLRSPRKAVIATAKSSGWSGSKAIEALARNQVFLDLPEDWH